MEKINQQEIFDSLNITKILLAILETNKTVRIPALSFLDAGNKDKELQVDYDEDTQEFVFKIKDAVNE
jgi:hypothetical protein